MALTVLFFLFGLFIGSFLNVCIYRLPRGESIVYPGSHCPQCGMTLRAWDLVPVLSYFFLKGRCRGCGTQISPRYPLVEIGTGVVFIIVFGAVGIQWRLVSLLLMASTLLVIVMIDWDNLKLPVGIVTFLIGVTLVDQGIILWQKGTLDWRAGALGIVLGLILFLLIFRFQAGTDAWPIAEAMLGAGLGLFLGWQKLLLVIGFGLVLSGIGGKMRARESGRWPLLMGIGISTFWVMLYGDTIIQGFLSIR